MSRIIVNGNEAMQLRKWHRTAAIKQRKKIYFQLNCNPMYCKIECTIQAVDLSQFPWKNHIENWLSGGH